MAENKKKLTQFLDETAKVFQKDSYLVLNEAWTMFGDFLINNYYPQPMKDLISSFSDSFQIKYSNDMEKNAFGEDFKRHVEEMQKIKIKVSRPYKGNEFVLIKDEKNLEQTLDFIYLAKGKPDSKIRKGTMRERAMVSAAYVMDKIVEMYIK